MDQLTAYRKQIDTIDQQILNLLIKRFAIGRKLGLHKKEHDLLIIDTSFEKQKLDLLKTAASTYNISTVFIERLWKLIFRQSYKSQS